MIKEIRKKFEIASIFYVSCFIFYFKFNKKNIINFY